MTITGRLARAAVLLLLASAAAAWTDEPLVPGQTRIRAVHILELRAAIDNKRASVGMAPYQWTDPALAPKGNIRAVDITDLRAALTQLDAFLGCPPITFTDPNLTPDSTHVRSVHIEELRHGFDNLCSGQCYACRNTGAMTCGVATTAPVKGACPNGYSATKPALCYPACFACSAYTLSIDAGHNCFHCGTACGSIPNTCWSIVQNISVKDNKGQLVSLNGICPYCPAPPSCWMGGFGSGKDPSDPATACALAQNQANGQGVGGGRSSCGLNEAGNFGPNNTCDCSANCVTVSPPVCP